MFQNIASILTPSHLKVGVQQGVKCRRVWDAGSKLSSAWDLMMPGWTPEQMICQSRDRAKGMRWQPREKLRHGWIDPSHPGLITLNKYREISWDLVGPFWMTSSGQKWWFRITDIKGNFEKLRRLFKKNVAYQRNLWQTKNTRRKAWFVVHHVAAEGLAPLVVSRFSQSGQHWFR